LGEDEESAEQADHRRELERRMMDPGFTDEQMAYLLLHEDIVSEREQGIDEILQAITELSEMFRDLNQMVIEQGTVLDRIDYNLEQAEKHTGGAVKELDKASEYQRKARMKMCILLLIVGVGTTGVALFLTKD
jgi:syntaxin 16